jgi:hypothetical protein
VECGLKALYLSRVPQGRHAGLIDGRLKEIGHNLEGMYHSLGQTFGIEMPPPVRHLFRTRITPRRPAGVAGVWDVEMRYRAGMKVRKTALEFLDAVKRVLDWVNGA